MNACFSHTFCYSLLCNISILFLGFLKTENCFYMNLRLFLSTLLLVLFENCFYYLNYVIFVFYVCDTHFGILSIDTRVYFVPIFRNYC